MKTLLKGIVAALLAASVTAAQQPSAEVVVRRAAAYVERYTADLKFVLADEEYAQQTMGADGALLRERRMRGELYLAFLPADDVWIAVHDVMEVDGVAVSDRDDLRALLRSGEVTSVARRVADRNASFNIGAIARNFNEPTLPLLLLTKARLPRTRFRVAARTATHATLAFQERDRPTLVRSRSGGPVYARGTMVVDLATGRVEATTLELSDAGIRVRLQTTYAPNEKLDLWVPATFTERYEGAPDGNRELTVCDARYSNYRRFEVLGRIK